MRPVAVLFLIPVLAACAEGPLRYSVYATAGDVLRYPAMPEQAARIEPLLRRFRISRVFLEGRRGDEYVPPEVLRAVRDELHRRGFESAGGIATVPGTRFGVRQTGKLAWLNWEAEKTRADVAQFFLENAAVFDTLIVDDFFCTADTSELSERARAGRPWPQYRQDLLVSLLEPLIVRPAAGAALILKFPQWYDRFHRFGYDPVRMPGAFGRIWVGTEVRNPETRRMGFVQPTEGYINFRWLHSAIGDKVQGAWFDHIESTAQNFLDQGYQSALAGARELTLFHLGDLVEGHPGHSGWIAALPEVSAVAERVRGRARRGIAYLKPPGSEAGENQYLMDYLAMLGLPVLPVSRYPAGARAAFLGLQAAAEPGLIDKVRRHLAAGATVVVTPALIRRMGPELARLAGAGVTAALEPGKATELELAGKRHALASPLEVDAGLSSAGGRVLASTAVAGRRVPWLMSRGTLVVWNARTFTEADFEAAGELLLAPARLGLPDLPREAADAVRRLLLEPLGVRFSAPARIGLYLFEDAAAVYNFLGRPVEARWNGSRLAIGPNRLHWITPASRPAAVSPPGSRGAPAGAGQKRRPASR